MATEVGGSAVWPARPIPLHLRPDRTVLEIGPCSRDCSSCGAGRREPTRMTTSELLDAAGRRRSPATMPGHHRGRPPRNKGLRYPPDPPAVEEIVAVVRCAGESSFGLRTRALIVVLWRAGLRISEALALAESDLDLDRGALLVRRGKGRQAARSRHGRVGLATSSALARHSRRTAGRCAVVHHQRTDRGSFMPRRPPAAACVSSPSRPGCGAASHRTSSGTPTPSRWRARAWRSR
jgi:hypothetical protein